MKNKPKITIIGYGRFGKLFADILKASAEVSVITSQKKVASGEKKITYLNLKDSELVVFSTPISATSEVLNKIKNNLNPGTVVMDVCSVKEYPIQLMKNILPKNIEILGTHPMFDPDSVKNGLDGLQMVFCPVRIDGKKYNRIKKIFKELNLKVKEMTPAEHDKQSAMSLAFVHFVGRGLELDKNISITTLGYERLLGVNENVNNDTLELFYDMQKYNKYAAKYRKKFLHNLESLEDKILQKSLKKDSLTSLRNKIDKTDRELFRLLEKRDSVVKKIGKLKTKSRIGIVNKKREKEVVDEKVKLGHDSSFVKNIYKEIFAHSYKIQKQSIKNRHERRKK